MRGPRCTTLQEDYFISVSSLRNKTPQLAAPLNGARKTPVSTSTVRSRLRDQVFGSHTRTFVRRRTREKVLEGSLTSSAEHGGGAGLGAASVLVKGHL